MNSRMKINNLNNNKNKIRTKDELLGLLKNYRR